MSEPICGEGPDAIYCPVFWAKHAECEELRTLVAEILAAFERHCPEPDCETDEAEVSCHQVAGWRQRAGLDDTAREAAARDDRAAMVRDANGDPF
jgi:hypothetical protein